MIHRITPTHHIERSERGNNVGFVNLEILVTDVQDGDDDNAMKLHNGSVFAYVRIWKRRIIREYGMSKA